MRSKSSVRNLPVYQPGKSLEEVEQEYGLKDVVKLVSNENPSGCSPKVSEALKGINLFHHYPEPMAPVLRGKLAKMLNMDPRKFIFGNGSSELIQMICRTFLDSGDEAVLADFTYSIYQTEVKIEGAAPVFVPLKKGVHDLDAMYEAITNKTKVVWVCNPNNPTGTLLDQTSLVSFLTKIPKHVIVVLDEAYIEYVTDPSCPNSAALLEQFPQLIVLRTFSKIYGLAAIRMGYAIADTPIIDELHRVRPSFNTSRFAQQAAVAALEDQEFVADWKKINDQERRRLMKQLEEWGIHYYPSHGNFILFDTGYPSYKVFQFLLERGIIVRDRLKYPTYIRITIGTPEQNDRFIQDFAEFLASQVIA
ncbi:histidinol-phosphate transaminase [Shimazuella sp. KC615]|uniref:Histidinol-phosphate aminotransferase n=1 Tax=Shimazuella alba TaxID=2690964 RepID=A0A6I4W5X1_9BACL|nr:histidinol-phosphate transaminase [Shimazuella alba]